jgi:hypothetical protein
MVLPAGRAPPPPPLRAPPAPPPPPMDPVIRPNSSAGMTYVYNSSRATFRQAQAACTAWGGALVQVGTPS